ncbi:hypothetical protein DESHY_160054 [Desulforamulus hydrothermalis Lam5 = DSM 18033]|uniref:Uncharacterized protein n=1 Tax=Desulforamulus hydrothermalis Lam5 = DSM 18033 TaxID=1121428 RepID=K8DYR4_9FIRM|nr:hypothetical protein DESHY_160054 [Desulforamulus hydrothermalis Lam5 = DSM 18033]
MTEKNSYRFWKTEMQLRLKLLRLNM